MATAPASVGVKIPKRIPPMMMTGRHRGRKALAISGAACFMVRRSVRMGLYPLFGNKVHQYHHGNAQKHARSDACYKQFSDGNIGNGAVKNHGNPGGIRGVIMDDMAVTTVENCLE